MKCKILLLALVASLTACSTDSGLVYPEAVAEATKNCETHLGYRSFRTNHYDTDDRQKTYQVVSICNDQSIVHSVVKIKFP